MSNVYMIGSYSTAFKHWKGVSYKNLVRMAFTGVMDDCGIDPQDIDFSYFSNSGWGITMPTVESPDFRPAQMNIRGQVAFSPLVKEGLMPRIPCINVEGACASASLAFHSAWKDILSGQSEVALALGVEKQIIKEVSAAFALQFFTGGTDVSAMDDMNELYAGVCKESGKEWSPGANRSIFMDFYATWAAWHMWKWGTTQEQMAMVASKNHFHGSLNPLAQYRVEIPVETILADYEVSYPITRAMCSPLGDGAAAAILCSEDYYKALPPSVKQRAVKVLGSAITAGGRRSMEETHFAALAAKKAYQIAGVGPEAINLAEVHDATAFAEILQLENMGFCPIGEGGKYTASGETRLGGKRPVNTSGGLESKGHPIGATGLSQLNEIATQLRGEAGDRQVKDAIYGLVENGGGMMGLEESVCGVTILQRADS